MNKNIIASLVLLGCTLHAAESRIEVRHREAGGVGYSTGYTSLDYFLMGGNDVEFLLDLRGHIFNNGRGAGNGGLGFRCPVHDEKYLIGANAFYDVRQSKHLVAHQVGAGIEWLSQKVDFRANGYIPVGKTKTLDKKTFGSFSGSRAVIQRKLKAVLPSVDAEIGTPLPKPFYFGIGAYYLFKQSESKVEVGQAFGGKFRAEVDLGKYVTLGFAVTYDHIFKTRPQGYLSINIPFGGNSCKKRNEDDCEDSKPRNLRSVPIVRNEIIPVQTKRRSKDIFMKANNTPAQFFFVNNLAPFPGDGTFEHPFASLKDAEEKSAPGDVIYVFPGDGTPKNYDEGIVLKKDQVLASSGAPLTIEDLVIPAQTPGVKPQITNIHVDKPMLTVDDIVINPGNTHIDDFFWVPPWEYIFGRGPEIDHYDLAREEDFVIIDPDKPVTTVSPGGIGIIDNYQPKK